MVYDKVDPDDIQPYATAVQGRGEDIYVINTVISTAWTGIDLETYRCDRHYIEGYNFYCLKTGIAIGGGSRDGIVTDAQSNPWHNNPGKSAPHPRMGRQLGRKAVYIFEEKCNRDFRWATPKTHCFTARLFSELCTEYMPTAMLI